MALKVEIEDVAVKRVSVGDVNSCAVGDILTALEDAGTLLDTATHALWVSNEGADVSGMPSLCIHGNPTILIVPRDMLPFLKYASRDCG